MVKKFIRDPAKINRQVPVVPKPATGTRAITQKGKVIRANNRSVPLNPQGSRNNPKAGNFATKRRKSVFD